MAKATKLESNGATIVIPWNATASVEDGDVLTNERIVGVAITGGPDASAGDRIALQIGGDVYEFPKAEQILKKGASAFWNSTGDPYNGTAGSGCVQNSGGTFCGYQTFAQVAATETKAQITLAQAPVNS